MLQGGRQRDNIKIYIINLKAITEKQKIVANKQSRKVIANKPTYYKIE